MKMPDLPPLTFPPLTGHFQAPDWVRAYTLAYAAEVAALVREECAKIVDGVCPAASQLDLRKVLAAAIREQK